MPKISALPSLSGQPADDDVYPIVDTSAGATKKTSKSDSIPPTLRAIRVYAASTTWSRPAAMAANASAFAIVEVIGGGGSGGGVAAGTASNGAASSGGGGGGYSREKIAIASLGSSETVTIGAGATVGAAGSGNGNAGGTTSFGAHLQATGGAAGLGDAMHTHNTGGAPVVGGVGSGGDVNLQGGPSILGILDVANGRGNSSKGGDAGFQYGVGGEGQRLSGAGSTAGINGYNYGGGGSGAIAQGSGAARSGGAGAGGLVIVEEWY